MAKRDLQYGGLHVAIIMDGNGRWATARGLARIEGHRRGAAAVRRAVEAAPHLGIGTLTLYAFSSDNWRRPDEEVSALLRLFLQYLRKEAAECAGRGVRISVIGRRDRLPPALRQAIEAAERSTAGGANLHLRLAVDYSSRDAILQAAGAWKGGTAPTREDFARLLSGAVPDVDLLIRTGGEQRLSDFLLWECAYAELHFTRRMWPDFERADLETALRDFRVRERRFGALPAPAAAAG
ncbi:MAG TPA: di-trans,poly-cis-decaprenylcistransferase [Bryobacteraceae bacterium]